MRPELLAPAGSKEALTAAVQAGADAVYLGFGAFNARRNAKNFSAEDFAEAVAYCHLRGVKVYLTLNTLLTDRELPRAAEAAETADALGVDAILVQDLGVLDMLRVCVPDTPLHASTQMSLFTLGGVREAAALGLTRAVLARELSREDVAALCRDAPIELECFVHGALCMCCSGQCAMSALIGGRSGNRGLCAQPCRLPYGVDGRTAGYPLSLKDSCLAAAVPELAAMGVSCLKLEGRMKRPEYVALVTSVYARLLRENRGPTAEESEQLRGIFSRGGFTDGYWRRALGPAMFGVRPEGETEPKALLSLARSLYEPETARTVPVRLRCRVASGVPAVLTAEDGDGNLVSVSGDVPEPARTRALTAEEAENRLARTGGTVFSAELVSAEVEDGLMLSAASLNALRRSALERLTALRLRTEPRRRQPYAPPPPIDNPAAPPRFTCSCADPAQLTAELLALAPARIYLPLERIADAALPPLPAGTELVAVPPRVWRDRDEDALRALLRAAKARGISSAAVGNLGQLSLCGGLGLRLYGDLGLNIFNSAAVAWCAHRGLESVALSFELRQEQLRDIRKALPAEAVVYGRLPMMITENCLLRGALGCDGRVCRGTGHVLRDRTGAEFPILPAFGCRSELQNDRVLFLADRDEYRRLGLSFARLRFTTEAPGDCVRVLRRYRGEGDWMPERYTRGLYTRGVE